MPIYEYQCNQCNYRFERMQSFKDEPVKVCPRCGQAVRRVIQPVGIVFKGSGFYITDNRQISSTTNGRSKSKELAAPHSESEAESKPDAKPEAKPESKKESAGAGSQS